MKNIPIVPPDKIEESKTSIITRIKLEDEYRKFEQILAEMERESESSESKAKSLVLKNIAGSSSILSGSSCGK